MGAASPWLDGVLTFWSPFGAGFGTKLEVFIH